MKTIAVTNQSSIKDLLTEGSDEEVVITREGRVVAMIIPFDDDDLEWYARERDPKFIESIAKARQEAAAGQTVSHEALKKELGIE